MADVNSQTFATIFMAAEQFSKEFYDKTILRMEAEGLKISREHNETMLGYATKKQELTKQINKTTKRINIFSKAIGTGKMQQKNRTDELAKYSINLNEYDESKLDLLNLKSHERELREKISLMKEKLSEPLHGASLENDIKYSKHKKGGSQICVEDQLENWSQWLKLVDDVSESNHKNY